MKPDRKLTVYWWKAENDFGTHYPTRKADGGFILSQFCDRDPVRYEGRSVIEELEHRGFNTKTIKFSCELYPAPPPDNVAMAKLGAEDIDGDGRSVSHV